MCRILKAAAKENDITGLHAERLLQKEGRRAFGALRHGNAHKGCAVRPDKENASERHMSRRHHGMRAKALELAMHEEQFGKRVRDIELEDGLFQGGVFTMSREAEADWHEYLEYEALLDEEDDEHHVEVYHAEECDDHTDYDGYGDDQPDDSGLSADEDAEESHRMDDEWDGIGIDPDQDEGHYFYDGPRLADEWSLDDLESGDHRPAITPDGLPLSANFFKQERIIGDDGVPFMACAIVKVPSVSRQNELCRGMTFGGVVRKGYWGDEVAKPQNPMGQMVRQAYDDQPTT